MQEMRWTGHIPRVGRGEIAAGFKWGNLRESDHLEDLHITGGILLRWILEK
jgi:hypothetical protein